MSRILFLDLVFPPKLKVFALACLAAWLGPFVAGAAETQQIELLFVSLAEKQPAALSNLDPFIADQGIPGAELAIRDNNTTGQFTSQKFSLRKIEVATESEAVQVIQQHLERGQRILITRLPASVIRQIAGYPALQNSLLLDISTSDDDLRKSLCNPNILHLRPSRAMRVDALAQYMLKKRWRNWLLVIGPAPQDLAYAEAVQRAAKRYAMKIVAQTRWQSKHDARRTAQSEVSLLTQHADYDVVVVADEQGLFGEYLDYRTWLPRPVIGTQGLVAVAWDRNHEQWGAVQLQNRFRKAGGRTMTEQDYTAWLAVRSIGEAATRTGKTQVEPIKTFIRGDEFSVAGFKGKKLTFRRWNGQLRQPVLLAAPRSLVAVPPLKGFLHPNNELDSLGYGESETNCGGPG